ncbi:MAG: hypothetical protein KatS3mg115_2006 [Candidatus Poribacteria bacterium]|nr:MAG: hypothetical protein KatS3mg115_2006 [Candidatus Poribacteria bacterium]
MNTVRVMGWVKQPRVYELKAGMRVSDAVRVAGGLRPEADRNRADVFRLNPDGETTTLIPVNLEAALSGDAEADVPLAPLDRLVVYRTNETRFVPSREVAVQGAVARPGSYPRADGMRLSDLLRLSGGVRDDAYRQRAMLMRLDDHGRLAVHQPVRLDRLEAGDPQEDPLLRDGDVLLVLRYEEAVWQPAQIVRVTGAVQEPGDVPFLEGMRVSDALLRAGGVEGDHADVALLLRKSERWDYVRTALTINLNAVLAGEESADLPLQPEDEIVVYRAPEVVWEPDPFVTVTGAVQRPDVYPRTEGMRISDLVFQAGGVLPNAYLSRADLIRYLDDYETQITIPVDLQAALAGDEGADLPLRDGDTLRILTIREALYYPEETVTIYGAVQRPDTYRWTEGMTLQDLLFVAGGVVPGHRPEVEIARARGEGRTEVFRVDLRTSTEGDLRNIPIYPGDVVSVLKSSTFYDVPRMVIVLGEVQYPGAYAIEGTDRISDLIERAGGLTKFAYAPGATLTRQADRLIRPERRATLQELWAIIEAQNRLEYQRALAKARVEAQQSGATVESLTEFVAETVAPVATIIGPEGATSSTPPQETSESDSVSPGEAAQVVTEVAQPAAQEEPFSVQLVTPARRIANLFPSNEVVIDLPEILEKRGSEVDLILEPGDVIYVPRVNNTVYIVGAVVSPKAVTYRKEWDLDDYLNQVGGLTQDADKDHIVVTRMNGRTIPKDKLKRIEPGDTISVPTRVLRERVTSRWDPLFSFLRFTVTTVATAVVIYAALNR